MPIRWELWDGAAAASDMPPGQRDSLYLQAEIRQRMTTDNYRQQSRIIDRENAQVSNRQRLFTPGGRAPISFYCLTMTVCCLTITSLPELNPPGTERRRV
jgi:hypothetical protein